MKKGPTAVWQPGLGLRRAALRVYSSSRIRSRTG